jgi:hypothetical protein
MDDVVNRLAKELAEIIGEVVAKDPRVEDCRTRARESGLDMQIALEAIMTFRNHVNVGDSTKAPKTTALVPVTRSKAFDLTANDRRFLRSLRIGSDEAKEAVE